LSGVSCNNLRIEVVLFVLPQLVLCMLREGTAVFGLSGDKVSVEKMKVWRMWRAKMVFPASSFFGEKKHKYVQHWKFVRVSMLT
jgi:hypothetical protein